MTDFQTESSLASHYACICGMDEVGRGALFGPVVAGAVILHPQRLHAEIDDSKKLSPKKRLELAEFIYTEARACSIGWCWNDEIDRHNILQATQMAMAAALHHLPLPPDFILLDGLDPGFLGIRGCKVIRGDQKCMSIAAASIIAKVFRDQLLEALDRYFPGYGLGQNKGYPTQTHRNVLSLKGMTLFHRESFRFHHAP